MSVFNQASGAVPAQVQVETKGGELGEFPTVLADLTLTVLVTADACTPGAVMPITCASGVRTTC
jgi:hypothetical protein